MIIRSEKLRYYSMKMYGVMEEELQVSLTSELDGVLIITFQPTRKDLPISIG
jgi:hypothetical protein